jgi:putative Mg2+ transporter-C (MgtC) family protein
MTIEEIAIRLIVALVLGMIIGLERVLTRTDAGMRTYGLMSMGSALFMLLAVQIGVYGNVPGEILRVLGQIATGIGFLGAGLIFFSKDEHKRVGMTSAATMWIVVGVGAACGLGMYREAAVASILIILTLTLILIPERWIERRFHRSDILAANDNTDAK